jgi:D-alanyl-D-alanine carboxypeptidase
MNAKFPPSAGYFMNIISMVCFRSAFICAVCLVCIHLQAYCIELTPQMRAQLRAAVEDMQTRMNIKGVSAAVITQNEAFPIVAGVSYAGRPTTPEMAFGIGSVTKTLTSTTLMRMQEEGLIDLDDTIGSWIPSHPNIDPSITVRQLLQHRSGLADFSLTQEYRAAVVANTNRIFKPDELLTFLKEPLAKPGAPFNYCNTNYVLAGMIITTITGKGAGDAYRRYIFSGLQMDSTYMGVEDSLPVEVAVRWMGTQSGQNVSINAAFSGAWTAGAVFSTAREIATFMRALHRGQVVSQASLTEMHTYVDTVTYGLGVSRQTLSGNIVLGHTGSIRGYESIVLYVPSIDVGLAVLVNQGPSEPVMIAARLVDLLTQEVSVVDGESEEDLRISPNPGVSDVTISGIAETEHVSIIDLAGREYVAAVSTGPGSITVDVSKLAQGVYSLVISGPSRRRVEPLVIQR